MTSDEVGALLACCACTNVGAGVDPKRSITAAEFIGAEEWGTVGWGANRSFVLIGVAAVASGG